MDDNQTATQADQSAPAPTSDSGSMTGDQVVDTAKEVLNNEPAMNMGSAPAAEPSTPANDAPVSDAPVAAPEEPAAPSEESTSDAPASMPETPAENPTPESSSNEPPAAPIVG